MKKMIFGMMLFFGGLMMIITMIFTSYIRYNLFHSGEYGTGVMIFTLITLSGLIICGYEAYYNHSK